MLAEIEQLLILQDRDQRIQAFQNELAAIPTERAAKEKLIAASLARLEASKARLREIEVEKKKLELEAAAKREQIARYKQQQMQTRKNEEYAALGHEIAAAERMITDIEDRELELMEEADALAPATAEAERIHAEEKEKFTAQIADLNQKTTTIQARVAELESGRPALAEPIDPDLMDKYQRLFKSKAGQAVVRLENDVCTGCHVKVPTQVALEVRGEKSVVHCPNCGRILFLPN